jgi:hypothetical protein
MTPRLPPSRDRSPVPVSRLQPLSLHSLPGLPGFPRRSAVVEPDRVNSFLDSLARQYESAAQIFQARSMSNPAQPHQSSAKSS